MLSGVSQPQKDKYDTIYMWNLKIKYKRIYIYKAERESQTKKKKLMVVKGESGGR